jgi:hypothetical protein
MIRSDAATGRLGAMLYLLTCATTGEYALAQAQVYRCTAADGSIEFRQQACVPGDAGEQLEIQDTRTGWIPPTPEPPDTKKEQAKKASTSKPAQDEADKNAERCWKKRQQLQRVENELRAGYKPARGEKLKQRRREYEAEINRYCR